MSVVREVVKGSQDILVTNTLADESVGQRASVVAAELRTIIGLALRRLPTVGSLESTVTGFVPEALGAIYLDSRLTSQAFSDTDRQVLRSLALDAAGVIENARLFTAARDKERLDQELAIARDIQQALLPKRFRVYDTFQVAGINIPSQQVGGDYYDLIEGPGERYAFVVADVCGKGISEALGEQSLLDVAGDGELLVEALFVAGGGEEPGVLDDPRPTQGERARPLPVGVRERLAGQAAVEIDGAQGLGQEAGHGAIQRARGGQEAD